MYTSYLTIAALSTITLASGMPKNIQLIGTMLPLKNGFIQRINAGPLSLYRKIIEIRSYAGDERYISKNVAVFDASSPVKKYSGYVSCGTTYHENAWPASPSHNTYLVDASDVPSILSQGKFAPKQLRGSPAKTLYRRLARQFKEQVDKKAH